HELNCLKYAPNDAHSLAETLHRAITEPHLAQRLGNQALDIAQHYHAEECYWSIAQSVQQGAAPSHSHQSSYHFL
ncbi:glycosyl transferase, partial [Vibrio cholerae]|nr:glycosyl transferase [Vibrio cholerae]